MPHAFEIDGGVERAVGGGQTLTVDVYRRRDRDALFALAEPRAVKSSRPRWAFALIAIVLAASAVVWRARAPRSASDARVPHFNHAESDRLYADGQARLSALDNAGAMKPTITVSSPSSVT